jgi:NADPH2:quinone reductase
MGLNSRYQSFCSTQSAGTRSPEPHRTSITQSKTGAFRGGEEAGLPFHRFGLEETAAAHAAVERGAVGKVLVTVGGA